MLVLTDFKNCRLHPQETPENQKGNPAYEASISSGKHEANTVTLTARGNLEPKQQPKRSWAIAPYSQHVPPRGNTSHQKTAWLSRHSGKTERDGGVSWVFNQINCISTESPSSTRNLTPQPVFIKLTKQTKKERYAGRVIQRSSITSERSKVTQVTPWTFRPPLTKSSRKVRLHFCTTVVSRNEECLKAGGAVPGGFR